MMGYVGAFLAGLSFGVLFHIRGVTLIVASIGAVLSYSCLTFFSSLQLSSQAALFLSSMIFSLFAEIAARKMKEPTLTFLVVALVILVPGEGMYRTMLYIIENKSALALTVGLETLANAGSLALGTLFVSTIFKLIKKNRDN